MKSTLEGLGCLILGIALTYFSAKGFKNAATGTFKKANNIQGIGAGVMLIIFGIILLMRKQ